jgi:hypothetical protein
LPPTNCSELYAGQTNLKISTDFSVSRSLVFKMKKLLDYVVDLMLWQRGGQKAILAE